MIMIATTTAAMEPIVTASQCMTYPLYLLAEAWGVAPMHVGYDVDSRDRLLSTSELIDIHRQFLDLV
jgi:hypothetical protein